jgi:hypothetical protein
MSTLAAPILVVQDNDNDRALTVIAFAGCKIANPIEIARDGQEALEYLTDLARPLPAVVLLWRGSRASTYSSAYASRNAPGCYQSSS